MKVEKENAVLYSAKWLWALGLSLWVSVPSTVLTLLGFMGMDILTGIAAAYVEHRVSSDASLRGLTKKLMVLLAIGFTGMLTKTFNLGIDVSGVVAIGYIVNESISIVENFGRAGVPIPSQLIDVLKRFEKLKPIADEAEAIQAGKVPVPTPVPATSSSSGIPPTNP